MKTALILSVLLCAAMCAHGETRSGPERYYYQPEWGSRNFQILRANDGGLDLKMVQMGKYTFHDDGSIVDGLTTIQSTWEHLDDAEIFPTLLDQKGNVWRANRAAKEGANTWTPTDFSLVSEGPGGKTDDPPRKILKLAWEVRVNGAADLHLKDCALVLDGGTTVPLFTERKQIPPLLVPPVAATADLHSVDQNKPRVIIAENSISLSRPDWIQAWNQWAAQEFPGQFGVDLNGVIFRDLKNTAQAYRQGGDSVMFESHLVPNQMAWVIDHDLCATRFDGFSPNDLIWPRSELSNREVMGLLTADTTQEDIYTIVDAQMQAAFDLDCDSFLLMDYVWPYFGGKWGYGPSAVQQWKTYVKGEGEKIDLEDPKETWSFPAYWAAFTSIPLTPEEFGWKSWDDFTCGTEAAAAKDPVEAKRLLLFNALWHYQHLAFLDRLGREAEVRHRQLAISINPEDINNGDDATMMARLRHLGVLGIEIMGNPDGLIGIRHTLPHLRYRTGGPRIDIVGEINGGGHGPSRYDPATAYAFYYDQTASVLPVQYNNQYLENLWPNLSSLNLTQLARFDHWFAGANGFLLRHQEEERQAPVRSTVTVVASRSVIEYQDSSTHSLAQAGNLAPYLAALNVDFEQVGRDAWNPQEDTHTRTLFFCPTVATSSELKRVKNWITQGEGKTLVIHGGSAWTSDRQPDQPAVSAVVWQAGKSYRDSLSKSSEGAIDETLFPLGTRKDNVTLTSGSDTLSTSWWESKADKQTLYSADDGTPLISEWNLGKNRVIHIQGNFPARGLSSLGLKTVAKVLDNIGIAPFAQSPAGWNINRDDAPGGSVIIAWKKSVLDGQGKKNHYDRVKVNPPESLTLKVAPNQECVVSSPLDHAAQAQTSNAQGELIVPLADSPEIIYYGLKSDELQKTIDNASRAFQAVENRTRAVVKTAAKT